MQKTSNSDAGFDFYTTVGEALSLALSLKDGVYLSGLTSSLLAVNSLGKIIATSSSSTQTLEQTLSLGNTTGTYSIIAGTAGSASSPMYSFANKTDMGIFQGSPGGLFPNLSFATGGKTRFNVNDYGIYFNGVNMRPYYTSDYGAVPGGTAGSPIIGQILATDASGYICGTTSQTLEQTLSLGNTAGTYSILLTDGSITTPSISFTSDTDTGIYRSAANTLDFAAGGERMGFFNTAGVNIYATASDNSLQFRTKSDNFVDYGFLNGNLGLSVTRYDAAGGFVDTAIRIGKPEGDGGVLFRNGSSATPSISFINDINTGMYLYSSGTNFRFVKDGIDQLALYSSAVVFLTECQIQNGSAAAPSFNFEYATTTGLFKSGASDLGISIGGATSAVFNSSGIILPDGSSATPSISFTSDTDTGIYRAAANVVGIGVNGAEVMRIGGNTTISTGTFRVPNGSLSAPTYTFTNYSSTGLFMASPSQLGISTGGATSAVFNSSGIILPQLSNSLIAVDSTGQIVATSSGGGGSAAKVFLTNQSLTTGGWFATGSYWGYTFSNANIGTQSIVNFVPYNDSYTECINSRLLPYNLITGTNSIFYSYYLPITTITGDIQIF